MSALKADWLSYQRLNVMPNGPESPASLVWYQSLPSTTSHGFPVAWPLDCASHGLRRGRHCPPLVLLKMYSSTGFEYTVNGVNG